METRNIVLAIPEKEIADDVAVDVHVNEGKQRELYLYQQFLVDTGFTVTVEENISGTDRHYMIVRGVKQLPAGDELTVTAYGPYFSVPSERTAASDKLAQLATEQYEREQNQDLGDAEEAERERELAADHEGEPGTDGTY